MRNLIIAILPLGLIACSPQHDDASHEHIDGHEAVDHDETHSDITKTDSTDENEAHDEHDDDHKVDADQSDTRQLGSHVHGGASLALVLEGTKLTAELETPLYNLLGFEHEPETDAQTKTLDSVQKKLVQGSKLFRFNQDAACISIATSSSISLFEENPHDDDHDDEHHDDEDDHDEEHHDDDEHHDEHETEESHRDVILTYNFICQNPAVLNTLSVEMLNDFPLMTELDVIYLGPRSQSSYEVTASNVEIKLRP